MTTNDPFVFISKKGNKQIRNKNGYVLMHYPKIPRNIKFKHNAVNDYNQHLCGGWSVYPHPKFEALDRVMLGLKPLGMETTADGNIAKEKAKEIADKGFLSSFELMKNNYYFVTASVKGTLGDYFDMKTLAHDYEKNHLSSENIKKYAKVKFDAFHNGKFDIEDHPCEIVGLVLGYPIENTISLIKRDL
ncbi:MAG: hypothetical protein Harvfovirus3_76 [Harvfovirus sp.]|uniref:Uncharacterized protein n=1 Tax=Harvfovirus sp. TaxID=2487768 RepID=A0A3G5A377_9VIRU|nr:MAG: hypothetical protein Harvfovirus3_76 [Harvfovirus sp.]